MGECDKKTTFEILDYFWEQGGYVIRPWSLSMTSATNPT